MLNRLTVPVVTQMSWRRCVPEQVRQRADIGDVRVLSVDEISRRVDESFVYVMNNDQQFFVSRIKWRRLPHKRGLGNPAYVYFVLTALESKTK